MPLCHFRDETAVPAPHFEMDGIAVAEQVGIIDERTEGLRRLLDIGTGLAARDQKIRACLHARFEIAFFMHPHVTVSP